MAEVDQLAIVARQRLEPVVGGLDEDLRLVAGGAQDALDAEHLVADRVAVPERGEHLVNPDHAASLPRQGPSPAIGSLARTSCGGRQILAAAIEPAGQRIDARGAGVSFFSRSNMSRYFRSITGQS